MIHLKAPQFLSACGDKTLLVALATLTVALVMTCWLWLPEAGATKWRTWAIGQGRLLELASLAAREAIAAEASPSVRLEASLNSLEYHTNQMGSITFPPFGSTLRHTVIGTMPSFLQALQAISDREETLRTIRRSATQFRALHPNLAMAASRLAETLLEQNQPRRQIYMVSQLDTLAESMENHLNRLLDPKDNAVTTGDLFGRNVALFGQILKALENGDKRQSLEAIDHPKARSKFLELKALFTSIEARSEVILSNAPALVSTHRALGSLLRTGMRLQHQIDDALSQNEEARSGLSVTLAVVLIGLLLFAGAGWLIWKRTSRTPNAQKSPEGTL